MKKIVWLVLLVFIVSGCSSNSNVDKSQAVMMIDTKTVYSEIDNEDVYIIDVREDYEYKGGHIKNAYNVSINKMQDIDELVMSLNSKIIVYCQSGNRSRMAANRLIEMGYTNVYDMGGINSWNYELISD